MTREEALKIVRENYPHFGTTEPWLDLEKALATLVPELAENEDEKIIRLLRELGSLDAAKELYEEFNLSYTDVLYWLEKQKDASKAIEAVDRIDRYIDVHVANAHDMKDSNPDKKYYRGWDDALGKMSGILQDVYSGENQKEQKPLTTEETELNSIAFLEQMGYTCVPPGKEQKPHYTKRNALFDKRVENCDPDVMKELSDEVDKLLQKEQHFSSKFHHGDWVVYDGPLGHAILQVKDVVEGRYTFVDNDSTLLVEYSDEFLRPLTPKDVEKPAEWSEDYREEDLQTRFAFYTYKDDPSVLYLSNVFVEESSRNHGFGTRILKAAEKVAEAIGAITICLKVKQDSPANAWYRKHGYGYVAFEDGYDWLEKNLEYMKPSQAAGWSENDERVRNAILEFLNPDKGGTKYSSNAQLVEWSNWLKSLPERFNLQPKKEWREVELEFRGEKVKVKRPFFRDDNGRGYSTTEQDEDVAWYALRAWCEKKDISLYDLYPREEWSEEDENMRDRLIGRLQFITLNTRTNTTSPNITFFDEIAWLKSLRPSWKPSEEQMKALERTVHLANFGLEEDRRKALVSLYEKLKKL